MCCKWEVFFSLQQEVICSVQQAFCWEGFLRSVSHALALSWQAGRQQSVESICFFPRSIRDHRQHRPLSLFSYFFGFLRTEISSGSITTGNQTSCTTTLAAFKRSFFFLHPLRPVLQLCASMDCICVFLSEGLDCSSGFYWGQIGLWRQQQQQQQQLNTNTTTVTSIEKITVRWPVIPTRHLLPLLLLLCYKRG